MTIPELSWEFRLFLIMLACYRLSRLVAEDDGPWFIFKRFRYWLKDMDWFRALNFDKIEGGKISDRDFSILHSLAEGLECPYCLGMWFSIPLFALLLWPTIWGDLFLLWLSISAVQSFLQSLGK